MDQLKDIVRVLANTLVLLAGAYLLHEFIQQQTCWWMYQLQSDHDDEQAGQDIASREGDDTGWPPERVIQRAQTYAPGAGD